MVFTCPRALGSTIKKMWKTHEFSGKNIYKWVGKTMSIFKYLNIIWIPNMSEFHAKKNEQSKSGKVCRWTCSQDSWGFGRKIHSHVCSCHRESERFPAHVPKKWSECETPERNRSFFGVHLYQDSIICKHPLFFGCFWWVRCMISLFISIISGCLWWGSGEEKENGWHRSRDPHLTPDSWEISTGRENYKPWEKCWVLQWVLQHRYGKPLNLTQFLDHFPWKVHEIHGFSTSIAGSEIFRLGSRPVSASPSCRLQSWFDETELDLSG